MDSVGLGKAGIKALAGLMDAAKMLGNCGDCQEGVMILELTGTIAACQHCKIFPDDNAAIAAVWELLCKATEERLEMEQNEGRSP